MWVYVCFRVQVYGGYEYVSLDNKSQPLNQLVCFNKVAGAQHVLSDRRTCFLMACHCSGNVNLLIQATLMATQT